MLKATALAPWTMVPVLALWIFVGHFDEIIDVVNGERYFFETMVKYLTFFTQASLFGIGFAYAVTLIVLIPFYLVLEKLKSYSFLGLPIAGGIAYGLPGFLFKLDFDFTAMLVLCGVAVATTFSVIINK